MTADSTLSDETLSPEVETPVPESTPGSQLARAREQAGLSREELARRLCMTVQKLELLERDEYQRLPGALYVRGYIRNACKELGVDAAPVLEAFAGYSQAEEATPAVVEHVRRAPVIKERPSRGGGFRGLALLALVAAAGVFWWTSGRELVPPEFAAQFAQPDQASELVETAAPAPTVSPQSQDLDTGAEAEIAVEPEASPVQEVLAAADTAPPAGNSAEMEAPAARAEAVEPLPEQRESTTGAADAPVAQTGDLEIRFSEESWAEVTDAAGNNLLAKLQPAGSSVSLHGQPPFRVMLGNAAGASVSYRGREVDSAPIGNRRTRRLTVE